MLIAEPNRDKSKHSDPFNPLDFNPHAETLMEEFGKKVAESISKDEFKAVFNGSGTIKVRVISPNKGGVK